LPVLALLTALLLNSIRAAEPEAPPVITQDPQDVVVYEGNYFTLYVAATGSEPLTYNWQKDGLPLSSVLSPFLDIFPATAVDAGIYSVTVTNMWGSVTSRPASVIVLPIPPYIINQPHDRVVHAGADVQFAVEASPAGSLTYQWLKDGIALASANSAMLNLSNVQVSDAGTYSVIVSNGVSFTSSNPARLVVEPSGPLDNWRLADAPAGDSFTGIAFGNGQFVVVGADSTILSSTDTTNWVSQASEPARLYAVAYGGGLFVAVGEDIFNGTAVVLTSPDAVEWTARQVTTNAQLFAIAYGAGVFVAVGVENASGLGLILSSPDGMNWTRQGNDSFGQLIAVARGNGRFVGVQRDGQILTSVNGTVWGSPSPYGLVPYPNATTYGAGSFISVGDSEWIPISPDGINWLWYSSGIASSLLGAAYGNGNFVTVGESGAVATSHDGVFWLQREIMSTMTLRSAAYGHDRFVVVGDSGTVLVSDPLPFLTPEIVLDLADTGAREGDPLALSVGVKGGEPLFYQWYRENRLIADATGAELFLESGRLEDSGNYSVLIYNSQGSVTSRVAQLVIEPVVPPMEWHWRNPYPTAADLRRVVYGNGQFVALGDDNTLFSSTNALDWRPNGISTGLVPSSFAFGEGQFIGVSSTYDEQTGSSAHYLLLSSDGSSWRTNLITTNGSVTAVAAGNGLYVAIGSQWEAPYNKISLVSHDGAHWQTHGQGENTYWRNLTFANGWFVATANWYDADIGRARSFVYRSADGIQWSQIELGTNSYSWITETTFGNGLFLVGLETFDAYISRTSFFTSPDAATWSEIDSVTNFSHSELTFGNGAFVVVGYLDNFAATALVSTDAVHWVEQDLGNQLLANDVTFGQGRFVIVGQSGEVLTSPDGAQWLSPGPSLTHESLRSVTRCNDLLVAVGANGAVLVSSDGSHWTNMPAPPLPFGDWVSGITYGQGQFVAISFSGAILRSTDAAHWTRQESGIALYGIAYAEGVFVAVGSGYTTNGYYGAVLTSSDAVTWTERIERPYQSFNSVTYGNGRFVVVGSSPFAGFGGGPDVDPNAPIVFFSSDGVNWNPGFPGPFEGYVNLNAVAYGNGAFVAVGGGFCYRFCRQRYVWTSVDGEHWTVRIRGEFAPVLRGIAYAHGAFVAVGDEGTILSSAYGIFWTTNNFRFNYSLSGVAAIGRTFVVVGERGTILQSDSFSFFNSAPIAVATVMPVADLFSSGNEHVIISTNNIGANVLFDGSGSSDTDGDLLEYRWWEHEQNGALVLVAGGIRASNQLALGQHTLSLIVSDGVASDTNGFTVQIITAAEAVERIITILRHSDVGGKNKRPLLASLEVALRSFEGGHFQAGLHLLRAFQQKVRTQLRDGDEAALASQLFAAAQTVQTSFGAGSRPKPPQIQVTGCRADGALQLRLTSEAGLPCVIESSTDLRNWSPWLTVTNPDGVITLFDPAPAHSPHRFYRAVMH